MSVRVQNKKIRDSTICKKESHKILCVRDTQKLNKKEDESCEELFTTNMIIPYSSLVPCVMQVHEEKDVKYDMYEYVASQDIEVINESHLTKLRE